MLDDHRIVRSRFQVQVAQNRKRKREAGARDDVEEPRKRRFVKRAALDPDLRPPPPPASAATSRDDKTVSLPFICV